MSRITAFMIVRNEEAMLPRCLHSLEGVVDELVILDTGSSDGTVALLEAETCAGRFERVRWLSHEFRDFGSARQASLDLVETEWALWMDADEALSEKLRAAIVVLRDSGGLAEQTGWIVTRSNRVLGRVMTGCKLQGNDIMRLFRTRCGRLSDSMVHEGVALDEGSTVGRLDGPLYHEAMVGWRAYLKKVDQYTSLDVASSDKGFNPLHMLVTGPLVFLKQYISRGGVRDGWAGFVWSFTSGWSVTLRDWKRMKKALGREYGEFR